MNFTTTPLSITPEGTRYMGATNEYGIPLGQLAITRDGRRFRFASVDLDLTSPGLSVGANPDAYRVDKLTPFFTAAPPFQHGVYKYTLTGSAGYPGAWPANWFESIVDTSHMMTHAIAQHSAIPNGPATPIVQITLAADDGILPGETIPSVKFAGTRLYRGLRSAGAGACVGVAVMALGPSTFPFGWVQVGGPCVMQVIAGVNVTQGQSMTIQLPESYAVRPAVAGEQIIGVALSGTASTGAQHIMVDLRLS